jgi:transposase
MRGDERVPDGMFNYVTLEQRVPREHPLREIRKLTDEALRSLSAEFDGLYSDLGRRSIAPEYVLRALLLQVFFSVRSERQLVEQIDYNLPFRWFVGMDDLVWNHAVFSKNRDRLLTSEVAHRFFAEVNERAKPFMSDDHFTVDGTLIQAWASHKSFRSKDSSDDEGGDGANFHGRKRSNDTHESTTDPDARHPSYAISLSRRWLVEKGFGWLTGPIRQVKLRGLHKVDWLLVFSCAAHNLSRLPRLIAQRHAARFG